jgi:hypothetical protein
MLLLSNELEIMRKETKVAYCVSLWQHLSLGTEVTSRTLIRMDSLRVETCSVTYMGHFINNAQGGKTAEWMMQS